MPIFDYPGRLAVAVRPIRAIARRYWYALACACLIVTAAVLRLYGLSDHFLWYDEIQAANNSAYTLSDTLADTRNHNSSPIIYPVLLWIVQKINVSAFSLRLTPAVASILVVAALLLLLPRVGVDRMVAFFSALLATVSVSAIKHAQDVREYSVDAFVATLMIAGLLAFLKDGRKFLLCASLFVAPLIQYGLVFFGVAVIATAVTIQTIALLQESPLRGDWIAALFRICNRLFLPALFFSLACVTSYALTFYHQWTIKGFSRMISSDIVYGLDTYSGVYSDVLSILEFFAYRTALFMQFHLPETVAIFIVMLLIGAALLHAARGRIRWTAIPTLFVFSIAGAVLAGLFKLYPFGSIRQTMYLSPILFLIAGHSLHSILGIRYAFVRRGCAILLAGFIILAGANNILASGVLKKSNGQHDQERYFNGMLGMLERTPESDAIWLAGDYRTQQFLFFYYRKHYAVRNRGVFISEDKRPESGMFRFRQGDCNLLVETIEECLQKYSRDFFPGTSRPLHRRIDRLWIITDIPFTPWRHQKLLAAVNRDGATPREIPLTSRNASGLPVDVRFVYTHRESMSSSVLTPYKLVSLVRVENFDRFYEPTLERLLHIGDSDRILIRSLFDVYIRHGRRLIYVKEPCSAEDTRQHFDLFIYPDRLDDLNAGRREKGFESFYFRFGRHGVRYRSRCVAAVDLPEYDIDRIRTGQYFRRVIGSERETVRVWEGDAIFPDSLAGIRPDDG